LGRQHELAGLSGRIDGAIEVGPIAGNFHIRLVDPPGSIRTAQLTANPLVQNRSVALDPPPDRDMVNGQATLGHHLFQVAIGERVSQIPPNAEEDDHVFEVSPAEGSVFQASSDPQEVQCAHFVQALAANPSTLLNNSTTSLDLTGSGLNSTYGDPMISRLLLRALDTVLSARC
jgi:hypothetical protein